MKATKPSKIGMHQPVSNDKPVSNTVIKKRVLEKLGKPKDFKNITVRNVFANKWRVNVWTETRKEEWDVPTSILCDSFFCEFKNNRLTCNPKIKKKY
tara:strand:+ start:538 stop:828 length:291 start_codon:yes stop_codon:yes gene_type:complete